VTWLLALLALPPAVLLVMGGAGLVLRWDDRRAEAAGVRCACGLMQTGRPRSGMDELVHGAEVCQPEREWLP
jgi:hypothetical protein